jgi:hypothetical protein
MSVKEISSRKLLAAVSRLAFSLYPGRVLYQSICLGASLSSCYAGMFFSNGWREEG